MLIERYNEVKKHVEEACKRVGRDPREVTVIAVSKTKPLEMVEELRKEKVLDFGENKVQEIVKSLAEKKGLSMEEVEGVDLKAFKESQYDLLADTLRKHLDMKAIYQIMGMQK